MSQERAELVSFSTSVVSLRAAAEVTQTACATTACVEAAHRLNPRVRGFGCLQPENALAPDARTSDIKAAPEEQCL